MIEKTPGGYMIICGRGRPFRRQPRTCGFCERLPTKTCDAPINEWAQTCDKPICDEHSQEYGWNRHRCPDHQEEEE